MNSFVPTQQSKSLNYQDSGVNIALGNQMVERIKPLAQNTFRPGVLQGLGGFSALFEIPVHRYRSPVLVSGTDGVGTKLTLAEALDSHDAIGIDLVAMCVNDIVTCGAEPLYFLDYFATGKLDVDRAERVISGIAAGCSLAGCALVGGETAEMPGMYQPGHYDLAGFAVGIVAKSSIIQPLHVRPGNIIIGLKSSGPHSNGYSLIQEIIRQSGADLHQIFEDATLGDKLIAPTKIYVRTILSLLERCKITAISHITGGGLIENIPRVLPEDLCARISRTAWQIPPVFEWIQQQGNIAEMEMFRTFNCGIGMIICVHADDLDGALVSLSESGEQAVIIGEVIPSNSHSIIFTD